jgi:hypothetical protein
MGLRATRFTAIVMAFLAALSVWSVGLLADMSARVQLHQRGTP